MKITRKSFMAGVSAAVLADWAKPVFAGDAPRPFGAGARVLERVGADPAKRAFYRAFRDFNPLNDLGSG